MRRTLNTLLLLIVSLMPALTSCKLINEDIEECVLSYRVRFVYDYNMSGGDGFPSQVNSVSLWVFDHATGLFVGRFDDAGEALSEEGYRLELTGLQPGIYDFIAWCGLEAGGSFRVPSNVTKASDLTCVLHTETEDGAAVSRDKLTPLFYGNLNNQTLPSAYGEYEYTVYLMKDTNNINLSLQHLSEDRLDSKDFTISMTYDNSVLSWNNEPIPSSTVTYYPWSEDSGEIDMTEGNLNYLKAELSTSRLMAVSNPQITIIDNATGNMIYAIPIVDWAKKLRSIQHLEMPDQEYLDREHEYTVMVFLVDDGDGWKAASIVINGYELD